MAHYFFHLEERGETVTDEEGMELSDVDAARAYAIEIARDIMSDTIRNGQLDLKNVIIIADARGLRVAAVAYRDALNPACTSLQHQLNSAQ